MGDTQALTVRLPEDLYEALRLEAFEKRTSQTAIIVEAVAEHLGLRPEGNRHLPRMPIAKEEFDLVMSVFMRVLEAVRPDDSEREEPTPADRL